MRRDALAAAFRATSYRVETGAGGFDLRIGALNPDFDFFLRGLGVSRWGLLTAHNPGAVRCDDENPAFQRRLLERLRELGWASLPALNVADNGGWPAEPGVLILQVGEKALSALAAEFFQLACVCGELGAAPRLVWVGQAR
jgi:hypothetical protein